MDRLDALSTALAVRSSSDPHPKLLSFPVSDALFARVVEDLAIAIRSGRLPIRLARRQLRSRYGRADFFRQVGVRFADQTADLWVAYRDGIASPPRVPREWWADPATPRLVIDESGRLRQIDRAARRALQLAPGLEPTLADLVGPIVWSDLLRRCVWLRSLREIQGSARVSMAWGGTQDVEFVAHWNGAGSGLHSVSFRSMAAGDAASDEAAVAGSSLYALSPRLRADLLRTGQRIELRRGESLRASIVGEPWAVVVTAGVVRLYRNVEGSEPTLLYQGPPSLVGTHWSAPGERWDVGIQGVTAARVIQLDPARLSALMRTVPAFSAAVLAETQRGIQHLTDALAARSTTSLAVRLAREILILQQHVGEPLLPITDQQLADGVGSIRESVARTIATFRHEGLLATTRHGVLILDEAGLRERLGGAAAGVPGRELPRRPAGPMSARSSAVSPGPDPSVAPITHRPQPSVGE